MSLNMREIIFTNKKDLKSARQVRQLLSAMKQHDENKDMVKYARCLTKISMIKNQLAKNNGLLGHGISFRDMVIIISPDGTKMIVHP